MERTRCGIVPLMMRRPPEIVERSRDPLLLPQFPPEGQPLLRQYGGRCVVPLAPRHPPEIVERGRDPLLLPQLSPEGQALCEPRVRGGIVAQIVGQMSRPSTRLRPCRRPCGGARSPQEPSQVLLSFPQVPTHQPELTERPREAQPKFYGVMLVRPTQRVPQIVVLCLQAVQPDGLLWPR